MPCFKGLAVSIHSEGPLPEYSIQKQSRFSRITSYIPVPPPKLNTDTGKPQQCSFSVSITLLTPGMAVPYSSPKPSDDDPFPRPQMVSSAPGMGRDSTIYRGTVLPYEPLTSSPNETIAAYIYFDGRKKEEVATLLRRGEETWVNSRWVSVPDAEGGGLAERDFLFREVGLERWLNGLDLQGTDVAAKVKRRREKMEKRRRKRANATPTSDDDDHDHDEDQMGEGGRGGRTRATKSGGAGTGDSILRYGTDDRAPLERPSDEDDDMSSDDSDSDDDPIPESAGQIKVALFRVLASGEIKKGEYSPQFDAHDDDDEGGGEGADVDHTTSFAKPKTLDPKTISTQTVTGIDGPDKPFAVFTFLYRGEKQLQKMGILKSKKAAPAPAKRVNMSTDFAKLTPLRPGGTIGFTGVREDMSPTKNGKSRGVDDMDSGEEDDAPGPGHEEDEGAKDDFKKGSEMSAEEVRRGGELADGMKKIKLKRQHSFDPPPASSSTVSAAPSSLSDTLQPPAQLTPTSSSFSSQHQQFSSHAHSASISGSAASPPLLNAAVYDPSHPESSSSGHGLHSGAGAASTSTKPSSAMDASIVGSPMKKQRASVSGAAVDAGMQRSSADAVAKGLGFGFVGDVSRDGIGGGSGSGSGSGGAGAGGGGGLSGLGGGGGGAGGGSGRGGGPVGKGLGLGLGLGGELPKPPTSAPQGPTGPGQQSPTREGS